MAAANDEPLRGHCLSMCPPNEMRMRQREKLVHLLECRAAFVQATKNTSSSRKAPAPQGDPQCFVKEFARSSAGREIKAADVRPLPVLVRTLRYLLTRVYTRTDCSSSCIHEFLCNRLRSIRQDLTVQDLLSNLLAAPIMAACVRFYTIQQYKMCEQPLSEFDPFLNMKQLQEVLASLVRLYQKHPDEQKIKKDQKPQFTFDLDDDEDEFLVTKDRSSDSDSDDQSSSNVTGSPESTLINGKNNTEAGNCESNYNHTDAASAEEVSNFADMIAGLGIGETESSSASTEKQDKERFNRFTADGRISQSRDPNMTDCWTNIVATDYNRTENCNNGESSTGSPPAESLDSSNNSNKEITGANDLIEREEMECLYLLLNFDNTDALQHAIELPEYLRSGPVLSKVLDAVLKYHGCGNYVSLLRLTSVLPVTLCCCLYLSLPKLQKKALQVLSSGYSSTNTRYEISVLTTRLLMPSCEATKKTCRHYGISVTDTDHAAFNKKDFKTDAPIRALERINWLDDRLSAVDPENLFLPHPLPIH